MMENSEVREHEIKLCGREELIISGVEDVLGFDESALAVKTVMGILNIEGSGLRISKLDVNPGMLWVSGKVDSLYYTEPTVKRGGFFKRAAG